MSLDEVQEQDAFNVKHLRSSTMCELFLSHRSNVLSLESGGKCSLCYFEYHAMCHKIRCAMHTTVYIVLYKYTIVKE